MPRKYKPPRKLWITVNFKKLDGRPTPEEIGLLRNQLIESIIRGDYEYPRNWRVTIEWRNREDRDNKIGEWTEEMLASRRSSIGWDRVVLNYLRSK